MRALYIHISGLVGLLVFLKEVLNYAPIERTILVAATTGATVYLMLIVGHSIVRRIMAYSPPEAPQQGETKQNVPAQATAAGTSPVPNAPAPTTAAASPASMTEHDSTADDAESSDEADAKTSTPDRAPNADRQGPEPSEPLAQTTA